MKKHKLLATCLLYSLSSSAQLPPELVITGAVDFKTGLSYQPGIVNKYSYPTVFLSSAGVCATVTKNLDNDITYGASIVLKTTMKSKSSNGTHIFVDNPNFGRIELGSPFDAAKTLIITGSTVARGSGSWGSYTDLNSGKTYGLEFKTYDFHGSNFKANDGTELARKISYYTPLYNGLKIGISYMPNSTNLGDSAPQSPSKVPTRDELSPIGKGYSYKIAAMNVLSGGISLDHDFSEEFNTKFSIVGRVGQSAQQDSQDSQDRQLEQFDITINNLLEFNVGMVASLGNISLAASYANIGHSFLPQYRDQYGATQYFCLGAAYQQGPVGASITYSHNNHLNNKLNIIELATDYIMASGLSPYMELALFQGNGTGMSTKAVAEDVSGVSLVAGILFKF